MATRRIRYTIEPMTLGNVRELGVRSPRHPREDLSLRLLLPVRLASAPTIPQLVQTMRGPKVGTVT
jgi:hypothetical protein